jgi:hypothetical protein
MEQQPQTSQTKTNVAALIIIALSAAIVGGVIYWQSRVTIPQLLPVVGKTIKPQGLKAKDDSTKAILKDLESIKIKDLDQEFQEIDQDLKSL